MDSGNTALIRSGCYGRNTDAGLFIFDTALITRYETFYGFRKGIEF